MTGGGTATDGTADEADAGDAEEAVATVGGIQVSLSLERKTALILVMKEAFKSYHLAWARSSIEPAFKVRSGDGGILRWGMCGDCNEIGFRVGWHVCLLYSIRYLRSARSAQNAVLAFGIRTSDLSVFIYL